MTLEQITRILKDNNNIFISDTTMRNVGKENIEKNVGCKIKAVKRHENGFVYEREGK